MASFVTFDENGFLGGFYSSEVNGDRMRPVYGERDEETGLPVIIGEEPNPYSTLPEDAIEISEETKQLLLDRPMNVQLVNGKIIIHDEPVNLPVALPVVRNVSVVAMAELQVNGDEISGVEQSVNIAAAMAIDVNVFWIFFAEPHETYIPFVQAPGYNADVTDRQPDYIEVTVTDRNNEPAAPASLSISIQKVI